MTQPAVTITELDGSLGVLPPSAGKLFALVGNASGTGLAVDTPATYARIKDVVAALTAGPLVEAAAHYIERYGKPVLLVKTGATVAASVTAVTSVATGTSVVTIASSPTPSDDYELYLKIITGGTRGTAGVTYQVSLDGGRTFLPVEALGTATEIVVTGAGGVTFEVAAGTFVAGDYHTARCTAAQWNSSEISSALTALGNSVASWEIVQIVGAIDATTFDTIDGKISGMATSGGTQSAPG